MTQFDDDLNHDTYDPKQDSTQLTNDPHFQADLNQQLSHHFDPKMDLSQIDQRKVNSLAGQPINLGSAYLDAIGHLFNWHGGLSRKPFFLASLVQFSLWLLMWTLWTVIPNAWLNSLGMSAKTIWLNVWIYFGLYTLIIEISLLVRRLHSVGLFGLPLFTVFFLSFGLFGTPLLVLVWLPNDLIN